MKPSIHIHPKPLLNRLIQYGALVVVALLVISAPLQIILTLAGAPGGLVICSAFVSLALALPVLMLTAYAPAVTVDDAGVTLHPAIWKDRRVNWDDIAAVKVYPLLPSPDAEISRKLVIGKQKYRPADGILLIIPGLPAQYRIVGFFAGVRSQPAVALTNRAHADYDKLVEIVLSNTDPAIHDADLYAESRS
jgi:hypothetical protein